jgi:hypothetical protein
VRLPLHPGQADLDAAHADDHRDAQGGAAKIGINTQTYGVIGQYVEYQALAHAIDTAGSLNAQKMAAALDNTSNLPTVVPGLSLDFTATPSVHNGYPLSYFTECTMQNGPYDLRYAAS